MHQILEYIENLLPKNRKHRNNGWQYFNCPCCYHYEAQDRRSRGNILFNDDSLVYNCFNCKYKFGFTVGQYMSKKMEMFLKDLGTPDDDLLTLKKMIRDYNEGNNSTTIVQPVKKRIIRALPSNYTSIKQSLINKDESMVLQKVAQYLNNRNPYLLQWCDFMWSKDQYNFLIPCYEHEQIVGYSLRSINDKSNSKYIHFLPSGYVYNYDLLSMDRKFEIITEGEMDAISLNCLSILSNTFTDDRLKRILPFCNNKEIIVVPDRDEAGKKTVNQILNDNLPFSVAYPNWDRGIKDCADAVNKYGRLYTLQSIIKSRINDKMRIKLSMNQWFN